MIKRISPVLFVATIALSACGGGDSLDKPSDAFNASIETSCQKAHDCMSSYDATMHNNTAFADQFGTSVADCVTKNKALITAFLGADYLNKLDASASAGRINYSSSDAEVCLDGASAQTCDEIFNQNGANYDAPAACDTTLVGTVATGGACTIDEDCAASLDSCVDAVCTAE